MWIWIDLDWDVDRDTCFGDSVDSVDSVDSDDLGRLFYFLAPHDWGKFPEVGCSESCAPSSRTMMGEAMVGCSDSG